MAHGKIDKVDVIKVRNSDDDDAPLYTAYQVRSVDSGKFHREILLKKTAAITAFLKDK